MQDKLNVFVCLEATSLGVSEDFHEFNFRFW